MNERVATYLSLFTVAFLSLALLGFLSGSVSLGGRRLALSSHPLVVRARYFALGLFVALNSQGYDWHQAGPAGFLTAALLLATAIRFRVPRPSDDALASTASRALPGRPG